MPNDNQLVHSKLPWSQRFLARAIESRSSACVTSIVLALVGFAVKFIFELWLDRLQLSPVQADVIDSSVSSCILAVALLSILLSAVARRKHVQVELARLGELNHHVRNGLQVILSREHCRTDRSQEVIEAVKRIEATIRELYPVPGAAQARTSPANQKTGQLRMPRRA